MRRLLSFIALVVVFFLCATIAHADTIVTFALSGSFDPNPTSATLFVAQTLGAPSGTLTIDTTTGVIEAVDLSYTYFNPDLIYSSVIIDDAPYGNGSYVIEISEDWQEAIDQNIVSGVDIEIPVESLVGYTGGPICSESYAPCTSGGGLARTATAGLLTAELTPVVTPEPSSFVLLATGMLALVFGLRRGFCG